MTWYPRPGSHLSPARSGSINITAGHYLRASLARVTTPNSPIGRFLIRVDDMLEMGQTAARAQSDVIANTADDPRSGLRRLATIMRSFANDLNRAAERAGELADAWPDNPPR